MTCFVIIVYIVGCILAWGRLGASQYDIEVESWPNRGIVSASKFFLGERNLFLLPTILSWLAFFIGVDVYFRYKEKFFLKFWWKYTPGRTTDQTVEKEYLIKRLSRWKK